MTIYFTSRAKARKFVSNAVNANKKLVDNGTYAPPRRRWGVTVVR